MKGIPVLMYHALEDADHPAGAQDAGEQLYILQTEQFRQQMDYLHSKGYQTYLLEELQAMDAWPEKAVVLTFDDGHESNFTLALPILQQYGFKAHFFITTGWTGTSHFLTADQIKALHEAGMGIGSHGVTHRFLSDLDGSCIEQELCDSKRTLEKITGEEIQSFSAPGGRFCKRTEQSARQIGYRYFVTSEVGLLSIDAFATFIPRCTIKAATSLSEFSAVVAGNTAMINSMAQRARLLCMAKKLLGNTLYEKIRRLVL